MHTAELYAMTHPFWGWLAAAALLLALEASTGSGYLLWPAASAGAVAGLSLLLPMGVTSQVLAFVILTIATTYLGHRFLRPAAAMPGPDINDKTERLVGRSGEVVHAFAQGRGRVFVDGSEWAAEADENEPLVKGARVEVVAVLGGAQLKVRAAAG